MNTYKLHDSIMNNIEWVIEDYCTLYGVVDDNIKEKHDVLSSSLYEFLEAINESN